jgi:tagaturonate reductase
LTALLYKRFQAGLDGFIILPCELIDRNAATLKEIILRYSEDWKLEKEFIEWLNTKNHFCNTLVDRIVTGYPKDEKIDLDYTDNMLDTSEYFHLWVIEGDKSLSKELPFSDIGLNVIWTDNLEMYRTRKVRILNGAHTSLTPYALLKGFDTVKSCIDDPEMNKYIKKCVFDEIIPTLDLPKEELINYANNVLERFSNPFIKHYLSSIALNSVSKFKVRVLPSILVYIKRYDKIPENLVFSLAMLIKFYRTDKANDLKDVMDFMKTADTKDILSNYSLWDTDLSFLLDEVTKYVD